MLKIFCVRAAPGLAARPQLKMWGPGGGSSEDVSNPSQYCVSGRCQKAPLVAGISVETMQRRVQHSTDNGVTQYRDGDSSCFRRYSDNLSLCILRFVSCGVNNRLRGAAHFKHVSFLHDIMARLGQVRLKRLRLRLSENALILVFTLMAKCLMCLSRVVAGWL